MCEDLKTYVPFGDVLAAVKTLHGRHASVLDYHVSRATSSVQGFTSLMLRVTAIVRVTARLTEKTSLIVKRLPVLQSQLEFSSEMEIFEREVEYFNTIVPILQERTPKLPLVSSIASHGSTLIMEDLCASGYRTVRKSMKEVAYNVLDISYYRLIMRKLAQLHVASLNIDWMKVAPKYLKKDAIFEGQGSDMAKKMMDIGAKSVVKIMYEMYPNLDQKYAKFLTSPEYFDEMLQYVKPDPNYVNVICQGDCWLNNMMFKVDPETQKAVDVKFIDLQLFRLAPVSRDILYFLYFCTSWTFRQKYEKELLQTYVNAFNTFANETPDRLDFETFMKEFDRCRFFGLGFGLCVRPMMLMDGVFPTEGEELSSELFESLLFGDKSEEMFKQFQENPKLRSEITEIIDEAIQVMDKNGLVK